jgi:hypothetical protein
MKKRNTKTSILDQTRRVIYSNYIVSESVTCDRQQKSMSGQTTIFAQVHCTLVVMERTFKEFQRKKQNRKTLELNRKRTLSCEKQGIVVPSCKLRDAWKFG